MTLVYATLVVFIQHSGHRSRKTGWLFTFVMGDIIFCGVDLAIITLLANAGLPSHCSGLATTKEEDHHKVYIPPPGFTTPGFASGSVGEKGQLDKFCAFERSYYAIALGLVFTYIATIILTVLRIFERNYTENSKCIEVLNSLERADTLESKHSDASSQIIEAPRPHPDRSGPSSEGVITRTASIRSNVTAMTSSTAAGNGPYLSGAIQSNAIPPRRPVNQNVSVPARQLSVSTVRSNNTSRPGGAIANFAPVSPIDEGEIDIGAALVADGPQYRAHQSHNNIPHQQYQPNQQHQPQRHHQRNLTQGTLPPLAENDILSPEVALLADGPQYRPNQQQTQHGQQQQPQHQNLYDFPRNVPLVPQGVSLPTPVKGDYLALASDGAADGVQYPTIQRPLNHPLPQQLSSHISQPQGISAPIGGGIGGGEKTDYLSLAADGSSDNSRQYPFIQRQPLHHHHHHRHNPSLQQSALPPFSGPGAGGPGTNFIYPDIPTNPHSGSTTPTPSSRNINPNYAPASTGGLNLELRYDGGSSSNTTSTTAHTHTPPSPDRYSISMSDVSSVSTALPPYQRYETGMEPQPPAALASYPSQRQSQNQNHEARHSSSSSSRRNEDEDAL
ncbi:hypothetical protein GE21DRAFT_8747 [Neurospora crassa]|nr:uncharacterized protein NCU04774 [Neurospora crassa OR74A]ESA42134.1 hypothetical protein, variant [Neurospora crassa OR74A]KHE88971.1 hypothetical protein GE21DRAFT_8747 [Neurospora crassa]|eukprot:XP_011394910.1 uncharacterized protein NCU04774 [Neurospora crassa OR74A]